MNNIMAIVPARMGDRGLKVSIAGREPVTTNVKVLFIHLPRMYLRLPEMA